MDPVGFDAQTNPVNAATTNAAAPADGAAFGDAVQQGAASGSLVDLLGGEENASAFLQGIAMQSVRNMQPLILELAAGP